MTKGVIPTHLHLMNPVIQALKNLGGSGTIEEIDNKVTELLAFSSEQLEVLHDAEKGAQTEIEYRLAWARTYLKKYGVLENSSRGVWALTPEGAKLDHIDQQVVRRFVQDQLRTRAAAPKEEYEDRTRLVFEYLETLPAIVLVPA